MPSSPPKTLVFFLINASTPISPSPMKNPIFSHYTISNEKKQNKTKQSKTGKDEKQLQKKKKKKRPKKPSHQVWLQNLRLWTVTLHVLQAPNIQP